MNRLQTSTFAGIPLQQWLLYSLLTIVWLGTLDARHLIPSDEGRYAEIAREMLVSGDWLVPRYNDYLYFEKPPLHIWMTALAFKLFGLGEWQARLWSGLTSLAGIFFFSYTATTIWGKRVGYLTMLMLASSPLWILGGHFNSLDMGMAFFMGACLCCVLLAWHAPKQSQAQKRWLLGCWVSMALAVLSKGLIGVVLPAMVMVFYTLTSGDWRSWITMYWRQGILLFLLLCAPWFVLITIKHHSFLYFFFIHEHFERFTTNEHARVAPWYYFILLIVVGLLPWIAQLLCANYRVLQFRLKLSMKNPSYQALWLCFCWFFVILVFFSCSHSKLPGYIIPVIPALVMLMAISIDHGLTLRTHSMATFPVAWLWQVSIFLLLFLIGLTQVSLIAKMGETYEASSYSAYAQDIRIALFIGVIGCILTLAYYKKQMLSFALYSAMFLFLTLTAGLGHERVGRLLSGIDIAHQVKPLLKPSDKLYSVETLEHTLPFYLEHSSIMVNFADELAFGIAQEPNKWIGNTMDWEKIWRTPSTENAFAIMTNSKYHELTQQGLPMDLVAKDDLRVVVRKPKEN